jgi:hypothetical protein
MYSYQPMSRLALRCLLHQEERRRKAGLPVSGPFCLKFLSPCSGWSTIIVASCHVVVEALEVPEERHIISTRLIAHLS